MLMLRNHRLLNRLCINFIQTRPETHCGLAGLSSASFAKSNRPTGLFFFFNPTHK